MHIGTYLDIEAVPLLFLLQTHKHFSLWSFCNPEGLKSLQKNFQANRRKKVTEFGYHSTSLGCIKTKKAKFENFEGFGHFEIPKVAYNLILRP